MTDNSLVTVSQLKTTAERVVTSIVVPYSYTATLTATWSGSAPFTQVVSVPGILETDKPHITPVYSSDNATALLEQDAWNMISKAETSNDTITFTCFEDSPSQSLTLQIVGVR